VRGKRGKRGKCVRLTLVISTRLCWGVKTSRQGLWPAARPEAAAPRQIRCALPRGGVIVIPFRCGLSGFRVIQGTLILPGPASRSFYRSALSYESESTPCHPTAAEGLVG
jgi:hypothetical protein